MRRRRMKFNDGGFYHAIVKIVEGEFKLIEKEAEIFLIIMRLVEKFSGVMVVDYVIMQNHVHLILFATGRCTASEEVLLKRYSVLYDKKETEKLRSRWENLRLAGKLEQLEAEMQQLRNRMDDISAFMKTLMQRVSQSYNSRHNRIGPLWAGRFKSLLVEPNILAILAAYLALNPARVDKKYHDPKDYPYCGYAAALGGDPEARRGLIQLYAAAGNGEWMSWRKTARLHRMIIYGRGGKYGRHPPVYSKEEVEKVLAEGGQLTLFDLLRCKVRYFTYGVAIGSEIFVQTQVRSHPDCFSPYRKALAKKFRCYEGNDLYAANDFRKVAIIPMLS